MKCGYLGKKLKIFLVVCRKAKVLIGLLGRQQIILQFYLQKDSQNITAQIFKSVCSL